MELQTASTRDDIGTRQEMHGRVQNHCSHCGQILFLPEWSEYVNRQRVRHLWECDACGHKFETLVSFPDA